MEMAVEKTFFNLRLAIVLAIISALALLYFFAPTEYAFYPRCIFLSLTGLNCPGCGSLRAMHQLLHGNFSDAFQLNPAFILSLPLLGIFAFARKIRAGNRN